MAVGLAPVRARRAFLGPGCVGGGGRGAVGAGVVISLWCSGTSVTGTGGAETLRWRETSMNQMVASHCTVHECLSRKYITTSLGIVYKLRFRGAEDKKKEE
jgi:hypothetical protein